MGRSSTLIVVHTLSRVLLSVTWLTEHFLHSSKSWRSSRAFVWRLDQPASIKGSRVIAILARVIFHSAFTGFEPLPSCHGLNVCSYDLPRSHSGHAWYSRHLDISPRSLRAILALEKEAALTGFEPLTFGSEGGDFTTTLFVRLVIDSLLALLMSSLWPPTIWPSPWEHIHSNLWGPDWIDCFWHLESTIGFSSVSDDLVMELLLNH